NVVVLGEVADAVKLMQSKAIMVVPLFSGSGIRVKILEGLALGKCILSTSLGAQGIAVENGKNILIANNEAEFIDSILNILAQPQRIAAIGKEARKLVEEQYENRMVMNKILQFYTDLIENNRKE